MYSVPHHTVHLFVVTQTSCESMCTYCPHTLIRVGGGGGRPGGLLGGWSAPNECWRENGECWRENDECWRENVHEDHLKVWLTARCFNTGRKLVAQRAYLCQIDACHTTYFAIHTFLQIPGRRGRIATFVTYLPFCRYTAVPTRVCRGVVSKLRKPVGNI